MSTNLHGHGQASIKLNTHKNKVAKRPRYFWEHKYIMTIFFSYLCDSDDTNTTREPLFKSGSSKITRYIWLRWFTWNVVSSLSSVSVYGRPNTPALSISMSKWLEIRLIKNTYSKYLLFLIKLSFLN